MAGSLAYSEVGTSLHCVDECGKSGITTHVLIVCAVNGRGGPVQSMVTVLSELAGRWNTIIASQFVNAGESPLERAASSTIEIPRPKGKSLLKAQIRLWRGAWLWRHQISVIHANGLTEAIVALPVSIAARIPVVVWVHNSEKPRPFRFMQPLVRLAGRRWTWLAVSELAADLVPWAHPQIVGNPVSRNVIPPERQSSSDCFRVVYLAGSDRFVKGFDLIPEIVAGSLCTSVKWVLYTSPPYSARNSACEEAWGRLLGDLADRVEIRPRTDDVASAFSEADVVLAPSRRESFNRVIAESITTGTPFIASDIAAHRALAFSSNAGLLFDIDKPAQAGALVDSVCIDARCYSALRANAQAHIGMFDPKRIVGLIENSWREASGVR
jgi:glycosyltransferase involved in cell wall biosynthesis